MVPSCPVSLCQSPQFWWYRDVRSRVFRRPSDSYERMCAVNYLAFKMSSGFVNIDCCCSRIVRCIVCKRWISQAETFVTLGRIVDSSNTLVKCQQACENNAECTGVGWWPNRTECSFMNGPWTSVTAPVPQVGATYYKLFRNCKIASLDSSKRCSSCFFLFTRSVRNIKAALTVCCRNIQLVYRFIILLNVGLKYLIQQATQVKWTNKTAALI